MNTFSKIIASSAILVCSGLSHGQALAQSNPGPSDVGNCSLNQFANCDSSPDQEQLELPGTSGAQNGNWADLPSGTSARPFVKRLALINDGIETVLLEDGTTLSALSNTPGSVGVVISPFNLCDATEDPSEPGNNCYSSPNRIGISVVYRKSPGQVGSNLSFPNDGDQGTTTGNALPLRSFDGAQTVTLNSSTVIDLTIGLNTLGQSLRWTWANGVPTFWDLETLGTPTATVRIKFRPAIQPALHYPTLPPEASQCTAIPAVQCELTQSNSDWLGAQMILSLDTTLSAAMTGSLFGTEGAIIGSLEASTDPSTGFPNLTYGIASSHNDHTGAIRQGVLRAFIPAAGLVHGLGIPVTRTSSGSLDIPLETVLVTRAEGATNTVVNLQSASVWQAATEGEDGLLMTIGTTFSAPQFEVRGESGASKTPRVKLSKNLYTFTYKASAKGALGICKSKKCTVAVYRASADINTSTITKIASSAAKVSKGSLSANFSIKKSAKVKSGTRLLVVVTNSKKEKLASLPITLSR